MGSTHLKALRALPGVEVAAVCSLDEQALSGDLGGVQGNIGGPGGRHDFSGVRKYGDPEEALAGDDIDAVDICLPTHLHGPVALQALRRGKHVLVEKPMALDGATAGVMAAEAGERGLVLMAAHVVRFMPEYAVLRELVLGGALGKVPRSASFRRRCAAPAWGGWLLDSTQSGGGIFDLLIHDVDFCLQLFGKPEALLATGHSNPARGIDCVQAQLFYPRFAAAISGGWHHPRAFPFSAEYTLVADGGTVEFSPAVAAPTVFDRDGHARPLPLTGGDGYAAEIAYFVACCRAGRQPDLCPPRESVDAVKLMRLIVEARKRNGEKIPCAL